MGNVSIRVHNYVPTVQILGGVSVIINPTGAVKLITTFSIYKIYLRATGIARFSKQHLTDHLTLAAQEQTLNNTL